MEDMISSVAQYSKTSPLPASNIPLITNDGSSIPFENSAVSAATHHTAVASSNLTGLAMPPTSEEKKSSTPSMTNGQKMVFLD